MRDEGKDIILGLEVLGKSLLSKGDRKQPAAADNKTVDAAPNAEKR